MNCYLCHKPIAPQDEVEFHHPIYKSRGGVETAPTHKQCHRDHHSKSGDFREWGKLSSMTRAWSFNLLNVRTDPAYEFDREYYRSLYGH